MSERDSILKRKVTYDVEIRRLLLQRIYPSQLLDWMPCVYVGTKQEIQQIERNQGQASAAAKFLDAVPNFAGWSEEFIDALLTIGQKDIANILQNIFSV
ncbi:unnamed protein product [Clavelina lepadiformis]|uniref:Caspase recruitment domain-containing protein n=1 Tax=Clavelina lepadiformis TaxID=159417 RepID=A0ABP0G5F8_CLALP